MSNEYTPDSEEAEDIENVDDEYEYDPCYECSGLGDDYYIDENGELQCYCDQCVMNKYNWRE